jgi:uncharacterized membrane protein
MKRIKKELPMAILILGIGFLFVICAVARAEQIDKYNEEIKSSYIANN